MPIYTYIPLPPEECKKMFASIIEAELLKHKLIQLPEPPKDELVDVSFVAAHFKKDRGTIYNYVKRGLIQARKIDGLRGLRFSRSHIEQLVKDVYFNKSTKQF